MHVNLEYAIQGLRKRNIGSKKHAALYGKKER